MMIRIDTKEEFLDSTSPLDENVKSARYFINRNLRSCTRRARCKISNEMLLVILIVIGAVIGCTVGAFVDRESTVAVLLIKFPGELFMRMLKMMIIPVIMTSIITGLATLQLDKLKRIGMHAVVYYMTTTVLAVVLGIVLASLIKPGQKDAVSDNQNLLKKDRNVSGVDTCLDLLRNIFPDNIFVALFAGHQTEVTLKVVEVNSTINQTEMMRSLKQSSTTNTLGLIAFSLVFGGTISSLGQEGQIVTVFFTALNKIFLKLIRIIIWFSPLGVSSLIAGNLLTQQSLASMMSSLGLYMLTMVLGLSFHFCCVLPLIYYIVTRKNPFLLLKSMLKALLVAFGTASSAGTLAISMQCLENFGVHKKIINLILPLGATLNMDGGAILEAVASITVAQMYGTQLSFEHLIIIGLTATLASIGTAAVPSAGLVALMIVLNAIGVPTEAVGILWSVDWIIDRMRTVVNVFGDCVGAAIVHHLDGKYLEENAQYIEAESNEIQIENGIEISETNIDKN